MKQPVSRRRLVKLGMPELEQEGRPEPRRVEICRTDADTWDKATLEAVALDGRAKLRWDQDPTKVEWLDLADKRYRWLLGEKVTPWAEDAQDEE